MKKEGLLLLVATLWFASCTHKATETYRSVIEIVTNDRVAAEKLEQTFRLQNLQDSVYRWENHWALYGAFSNLSELQQQIAAACPSGASIKVYDQPFYVFDRQTCDNHVRAKRWSHTVMTANLVADETLQREYMEYHATQAECWPEVANGFCKAGFEQVLVFRNGRQLMLIISIPEGESLDELNPKTVENNPRVDEWNTIMSKYQEGIAGTNAGESWVVLAPIGKN